MSLQSDSRSSYGFECAVSYFLVGSQQRSLASTAVWTPIEGQWCGPRGQSNAVGPTQPPLQQRLHRSTPMPRSPDVLYQNTLQGVLPIIEYVLQNRCWLRDPVCAASRHASHEGAASMFIRTCFLTLVIFWLTLRGPFSAVSTPNFASKYSFESS